MLHVELGWRELTDPPASFPPREPANTSPRGPAPPRLHTVDPDVTRSQPLVITADVWLAAERVNQCAEAEAAAARAAGGPNSMRLWRESHQRALHILARAAAGVAPTARCEAINWEQVDGDYHVTATFVSTLAH
jgi:hypothetical protein